MIRLANRDDAEAIALVHVQSWKETYTEYMNPEVLNKKTVEVRKKLWEIVLNDQDQKVWVYEKDGKVLGFSDAYFAPDRFEAELRAIYILQSAQGRGLGKQFLEQLFEILRDKKYQKLSVYVLDRNPSRYFYEKMGAKCVEEVDASGYGQDLKELRYEWDFNL